MLLPQLDDFKAFQSPPQPRLLNPSPPSTYQHPPMLDFSGYATSAPMQDGGLYQNVSPPLTPSPPMFDSMHFKRKFSVDVGPFGFGSGHPPAIPDQDQDPFRRSSTTNLSVDECIQMPPPQPSPGYYEVNSPPAPTTKPRSRAGANGEAPTVQHKHVCKYAFCGWSFKRYEHLKRHMLVHTGERPHVCQFPGCGKSFSRSDNFHAHCRTHTKKSFLQNRRGSRANRQSEDKSVANATAVASATVASVSGSESQGGFMNNYQTQPLTSYEADQYQQQFNMPLAITPAPSSTALLNHEIFPPATTPPFNYNDPFYATGASQTWPYMPQQLHQQQQQQQQQQQLALGRRGSSSPNNNTNNAQQKSHVCPIPQCQRRFKRLEHLKRHMRIHTLERPFACTFPNCHKTFSRSDNLSQHMKTHQRHEDRRKRQQEQQQQQHRQESSPLTCSSVTSSPSDTLTATIYSSAADALVSSMPWSTPASAGTTVGC